MEISLFFFFFLNPTNLFKQFILPFLSISDADNNQSDDMPIIAVMVALSSLLVIIFIIIVLYMLRLVIRCYDVLYITNSETCREWRPKVLLLVTMATADWHSAVGIKRCVFICVYVWDSVSSCINMDFDLCWLTGLRSTSRREAIQTPSDSPTVDPMIQVKQPPMR